MIRPVRFLFVSMFALALTACGDDTTNTPTECPESRVCGEACCSADETCVGDMCQPNAAQCEAGQTECGTACCDNATESCVDDVCQPKAAQCEADQTACGTACCDNATESCVGDVCQSKAAQCEAGQTECGADCCDNATEHCVDDACKLLCETPCGDTCCGDREACDTSGECASCALDSALADFTALDGAADFAPLIGQSLTAFMSADLPSGEATIRLFLRQGYGVFADRGAIYTGTFALEGDRLDFAVCDICVLLTVYNSNKEAVADYMASGGVVDLTDFSTENGIKATLRNVTFQQVDIQWDNYNAMEPSSTNCSTSVANGTFGATFLPQCDPMNTAACDAGSGCQYWSGLGFVCRAAGSMAEGEDCNWGYDCLPGLDCLGAQPWWNIPGACVEICREKSTCSFVATCEDFDHYLAGHCAECAETKTCGSVCCEDYQSCESGECVDHACPIDSSLGAFDRAGLTEPWYASRLQVPVPSSDGSPDILQIEIRDDFHPGTYVLEGLELSYDTCTLCVMLLAFDADGAEAGAYFAAGGTVEVTSVEGGLSAILHNVDFQQVRIRNNYSLVLHPQGCTASLTTATVSNTVCDSAPAQSCGATCCSASEYCDVFAETPACVALTVPPNDGCGTNGANAIALTLDASPVPGQTIGATADYSIPPDSCQFSWEAAGVDVVYSYTPDADGTFYVTVKPGFGYNPMLWFTTGTCGDGTTCTAATDAGWGGMADSLAIEGTAAVTYYIYVDHYSGEGGDSVGVFTIEVTSTTP